MSMSSLDIQHMRQDEAFEAMGTPHCGWCGNWAFDDQLFECESCTARQHHACKHCRKCKPPACEDFEECMFCGSFVTDPVLDWYCSDTCAAIVEDEREDRTCQACLREYDGPLPLIGYCSLSCWAAERGEL